jgi:hypothetical protein
MQTRSTPSDKAQHAACEAPAKGDAGAVSTASALSGGHKLNKELAVQPFTFLIDANNQRCFFGSQLVTRKAMCLTS